MYKCIIFDVDGTLVNSEENIIASFKRIVKEYKNVDMKDEELFFCLGITSEKALERMDIEVTKEVLDRWIRYCKELNYLIKPYKDIKAVLSQIKNKGILTGVVTSRLIEEFNNDIKPLNLHNDIDIIICADDTIKHKPHGEPLLAFLNKSGIKKDDAIYIGDSVYDFKCAKDSGVDFALALWGAKTKEGINAKYELKEPNEILDLI